MSRPARSMLVFSCYMLVLGSVLLVIPHLWMPLYGMQAPTDVWVRVAGMFLLLLAFYYIQVARHEMLDFIRWTVYARASVIVFLSLFVLLRWVEPVVLIVGGIDLVGAIWTWFELRAIKS